MIARYEFIDGERATLSDTGAAKWPVVKMCEWMEVSTSGFYEWLGRAMSATMKRRESPGRSPLRPAPSRPEAGAAPGTCRC